MTEQRFRPWGVVDPAFWAVPDGVPATACASEDEDAHEGTAVSAVPVSSAVAAQLASIQAVAALDLPRAHALAEQLDATTTTANGEMHVDTLRVREVRAYLVHLTGHHDTAVAWYLHVVRLHAGLHGANHEETALAVRRAYSMWKSLPNLDAVRLADDLINAFAEVPSAGTEAVRRMREHMRSSHQTAGGGGQECAATPAG